MKIYLAGPFFNPTQVAVIEGLEAMLSKFPSLEVYSPRKDGVLSRMTPAERRASTKRIFELNVEHIIDSHMILAVIDDRDVGTIWEIGFAYAIKRIVDIPHGTKIVTFTNQSFGLNVMLQECVDAHVRGLHEATDLMRRLVHGEDACSMYRKFDENVT